MRYRMIALVLALALAFSGCAETARVNRAMPLLERGSYAVRDAAGKDAGYLTVKRETIVIYDAAGSEDATLDYQYDESADRYEVSGGTLFGSGSFNVAEDSEGLTLTTESGGEYSLTGIARSDLPSPAVTQTPAPTETPAPTQTPSPTGTPAPTQTPSPTGTPTPTQTPSPTGTPAPTEAPSPTGAILHLDGVTLFADLPEKLSAALERETANGISRAGASRYDEDSGFLLSLSAVMSVGDETRELLESLRTGDSDGSDSKLVFDALCGKLSDSLDGNGAALGGNAAWRSYTYEDIVLNGKLWQNLDLALLSDEIAAFLELFVHVDGDTLVCFTVAGLTEDAESFENLTDAVFDIGESLRVEP